MFWKWNDYIQKVAETAVQLYVSEDKANVTGLVLAVSADFKTKLSQSDMFDWRLQSKTLKVVNISYDGEDGKQGIELYINVLSKVIFIQKKK